MHNILESIGGFFMKNKLITFAAVTLAVVSLAGCKPAEKRISVNRIADYFYEAPKFTSLDYKYAEEYLAGIYDNWTGGCTAVSKVVDGEIMVGRNMDLNISNKCAYVVRTDVEGKYETFGLSYTFRDFSPNYSEVQEKGISEAYYKLLPFMCDDVMNEYGLHVEVNMRHAEFFPNGDDVFSYDHTNEKANQRMYVFGLCQYIALNCKTVAEAKSYMETVDIYCKNGYWNYCFLISDADNNSVLLEPALGEYFWIEKNADGINYQANFYRNETCFNYQTIKTGLGREETILHGNSLVGGAGAVNNIADMYALMDSLSYSWFYQDYDVCKNNHFDPRSENIGEAWGLTYDFVMNPANEDKCREQLNAKTEPVRNLTRQEKRDLNELWESTFTEVCLPKQKLIKVRLFEDKDMMFDVTMDSCTKIASIA